MFTLYSSEHTVDIWGKPEDDDNLNCVFVCLLPNSRTQMLKQNGSAKLRLIHVYTFFFISKVCDFVTCLKKVLLFLR